MKTFTGKEFNEVQIEHDNILAFKNKHATSGMLFSSVKAIVSGNSLYKNVAQHLYLISNEKVTKQHTYVVFKDHEIVNIQDFEDTTMGFREQCKAIIATTDSSLFIKNKDKFSMKGLIFIPQIPESFIKAFVEAQGKITEVLVEYEDKGQEEWWGSNKEGEPIWVEDYKIKLCPDNTVIISPAKTYTREEMLQMYQLERTDALESSLQKKMINNSEQNL